jgi:hypothetical protein
MSATWRCADGTTITGEELLARLEALPEDAAVQVTVTRLQAELLDSLMMAVGDSGLPDEWSAEDQQAWWDSVSPQAQAGALAGVLAVAPAVSQG